MSDTNLKDSQLSRIDLQKFESLENPDPEEELRSVLKRVYINKHTGLTDKALPYLEAIYETFLGQFLYEKRNGRVAARYDALELAFQLLNNFVNTVICRKEFEFNSKKLLKEQINFSSIMGNRWRAKLLDI